MYLKSIEVHGFKSFANKLIFEFHNGITGIVGPNGSGKSNIADAVRWVLGEQSAKQLRGTSMQDVIFSGTEMRKPQSYAYVALTITNEDHKLNVPYEEVEIARRVYRSGESEYLLNGTTCRLKDVQELFFDTGIGKEGYSIIGQGQVDKILSGKPDERRELFDEAAGIVKFKKRKIKTEKDLEAEKQNLLRVTDILLELEKQLGPLEEQSGKAREYLRLKEELKGYEINMFLLDYENYQDELKEVRKHIKNTTEELASASEKQEKLKSEHEEIEATVDRYNKEIETKKDAVNEERLMLSKYESEIHISKQNIEAIAQGKEFSKERISALEISIQDTKEEIAAYEGSLQETNILLDEKKKQEICMEREQLELSNRISAIEQLLAEKNAAIYTFVDKTTEISTEQQKVESMLEQNSIKKAELTQKLLINKSHVTSAVEKMEEEEHILADIRNKMILQQEEKEKFKQIVEETEEKEKAIQKEHQEIQRNFHILTSKLSSLRNLTERYEGYGQSIRRVMEQKEKKAGIIGVVADIFQVEKKYETAVETALGGSIQNIVTEDETTAKELISFLKKNRFGRATFLPLTTVSATPGRIRDEIFQENGVINRVSSLVKNEPRFNGLIEYLLGRFILVDTIEHAIQLGRKYNHTLRIVTLEGDLLNPGGSMSGGAYRNSSNLLGRRREMEQLETEIKLVEKKSEKIKSQLSVLLEKKDKAKQKAAAKEEILSELQLEENTTNIKYEQATAFKEEKELEYNSIVNDAKELENQRGILLETMSEIENRLDESRQKSQENKDAIHTLSTEMDARRQSEKELQETFSALKLEISSLEQKKEFAKENLFRLQNALETFEEEHFSYVEEHGRSDEKAADMEQTIQMLLEKMASTKESIIAVEAEVSNDTQKRDLLMSRQRKFFDQRDELMSLIGELDKELFRLNAKEEKLDEQLSNQINYMWSEYEITYISAKAFRKTEDISYTRMKSQVSETKSALRTLGDVNVNAIEDYKSIKERYETLKTQHDDLTESEQVLRGIIDELDEEMRKQFSEKFAEIRIQFDKVFKELFGGGKGTLELIQEEETDLLEAGINIIAQPPGKKLANMMQLSGGERALTAIALLFAIQNLKPSPFCLLDEIEAALDDSNVRRYAKYLHKLTKTTQFIVITHRQGTMEAADALYGITMQEKGVSTRVSVSLIEDQLERENKIKE